MDCNHLTGTTCGILGASCFVLHKKRRCALSDHYDCLELPAKDMPETERVKREVKPEALARWTQFVKENAPPGRKDMTAMPLEKAVRSAIRRAVEHCGVVVEDSAKKFPISDKDVSILADCILSKEGYPTTIVSIKTWLNPEAIRETFAYSYLSKQWLGQRGCRVFMVALSSIQENLKELIRAFRPYLDEVYPLSGPPYLDDLLETLQRLYMKVR